MRSDPGPAPAESSGPAVAPYLRGERIFGDDLPQEEIVSWYREEYDAYSLLAASGADPYDYAYHALNRHHGFAHLPRRRFERVLGYGSFTGAEFIPILDRIGALTILDPSGEGADPALSALPVRHVRPSLDGRIPLPDAAFDLVTCLGVLHHVPNVTFVISELGRVLAPGGFMLMREPIVSLGDWTKPRAGLTRRERGIPIDLLIGRIDRTHLEVTRIAYCMFAPLRKGCHLMRIHAYRHRGTTLLDALLSRLFSRNVVYHPRRFVDRFCPSSVYLVIRKPEERPISGAPRSSDGPP